MVDKKELLRRERISKTMKSKGLKPKKSLEIIKKISDSLKGRIPWNKGLKNIYSEETKIKMGLGRKGKKISKDHKKKISNWTKVNLKKYAFKKGDKRIVGKNNPNWKGGVTEIRESIRKLNKYLGWRANVFKRDNYHCQNCGEKGYLEAHHIIPFSVIIENFKIETVEQALDCKELWDIGNGISYCRDCHDKLGLHKGLICMQKES